MFQDVCRLYIQNQVTAIFLIKYLRDFFRSILTRLQVFNFYTDLGYDTWDKLDTVNVSNWSIWNWGWRTHGLWTIQYDLREKLGGQNEKKWYTHPIKPRQRICVKQLIVGQSSFLVAFLLSSRNSSLVTSFPVIWATFSCQCRYPVLKAQGMLMQISGLIPHFYKAPIFFTVGFTIWAMLLKNIWELIYLYHMYIFPGELSLYMARERFRVSATFHIWKSN